MTQSEATGAIVFYFSSVTAVISLAILIAGFAPFGNGPIANLIASQRFVAPGPLALASLVAVGLLGGCGQILMTHCYRFADATVIAAFDYTAMIWAAALGYVVFAELPTVRVLIGAAIVVAAGGGCSRGSIAVAKSSFRRTAP